ncbi:Lipoprotein-releasing system transmembrane protein LolE [BD1-7 clade bacterium]|uniref:Lipoprotein-releasing system transmembrane protein LolE n=1 Tax=BD1-7 clade bacterium TaxID=2029982 RepID=A0A5S9NMT6_9GAMM|nr:Lipoprotein-releasing system transmembrane protein LolE [BD1-7 clade bacterium]CAA0094222.1 Lipoprotein-releasing system transmembrane protein LolE [BD1-7 clade bacterium]
MLKPALSLWIGLRYNRSSNKQRFLSLLSWVSLVGMMLGVAALIVVLSVMNGFQAELRGRMLSLMAHGNVERVDHQPIADWAHSVEILKQNPDVIAVAPWVGGDAMLSHDARLRAAQINGIDLEHELDIARLDQAMVAGHLDELATTRYGIVLGVGLARSLGLSIGDKVTVVLPKVTVTPLGLKPRVKRFSLIGVFEVGADVDSTQAYINVRDARKLFGLTSDQVHALRLITPDALSVSGIEETLVDPLLVKEPGAWQFIPWTQQRSALFKAIKMEKLMVTFMLSIVIGVAAFNLISLMSMMVAQKRNEIAVMRMMGMRPATVMGIFLTQGLSLMFVSLLMGGIAGVVISLNLPEIVGVIEQTFGFYIFDPNVFYISGLPSRLMISDLVYVITLSFVLSFLFVLYPAWRATRIKPVEALQYQ